MQVLHFMSEERHPKSGPTEYVVIADNESNHLKPASERYKRPGFRLESINWIPDLPAEFPKNRVLIAEGTQEHRP